MNMAMKIIMTRHYSAPMWKICWSERIISIRRMKTPFFATLKQEMFTAFQADDSFWQAINQNKNGEEYDDGEGFHGIGVNFWDEVYPEDSLYLVNGGDDYHPEMLKLIAKRLIWDILFPNEELPYYSEPQVGWLPKKMNLIP